MRVNEVGRAEALSTFFVFKKSNERNKTQMTDQAIKTRREYYKEWYNKNKEKRKTYLETYWEKKAKERNVTDE